MLYCSTIERYVQFMNNTNKDEQSLKILQEISRDSQISQRKLANELGLSLGKMNYCMNELKKKGLIQSMIFLT